MIGVTFIRKCSSNGTIFIIKKIEGQTNTGWVHKQYQGKGRSINSHHSAHID